jgi:hypothetical protein
MPVVLDFTIKLFDRYTLLARVLPAIFMWVPAIPLSVALVPRLSDKIAAMSLYWVMIAVLILLSAELARTYGRRAEAYLFLEWGGMPTTVWLRHQDDHLDPITKARYHTWLKAQIPGWRAPTKAFEASDPEKADQLYTSAANWLRGCTRDPDRYHLVYRENIAYGLRRNLYGLKPIGLTLALILFLGSSCALSYQWWMEVGLRLYIVAVMILSLVWLLGWIMVIRPSWVRDSADAYARALLGCCDLAN